MAEMVRFIDKEEKKIGEKLMSVTATISYSSLNDASYTAKQVSRKLESYARSLNYSVYAKLNNYNGSYTGNINIARSNTKSKIDYLQNKSQMYSRFSNDLTELKNKCKNTDRAVRSKVSSLTATFKKNNGIRNSKVENTIHYYLNCIGNSTSVGRWIQNKDDNRKSCRDYILQSIEDWWDYEGGKQAVKGIAVGALEIIGGVCSVIAGVAAIIAGGTVLAIVAAVASVIVGAIAAVNGIANIVNEGRAYNETHNNGDPALGQRRSGEDSIQDTLRRETDSKGWHTFANVMDGVNLACSVISIVSGGVDLIKNAYKWTTGSMASLENLRVRDILTKDNFSAFKNKIKLSLHSGKLNIQEAFKFHNFSNIKRGASEFGVDFLNNLKKGYINFDTFTESASSVNNWSKLSKTLISGKINFKTIVWDGLINTVVIKNVSMMHVATYTPSESISSGALAYKDGKVSISDITGNVTDSIKGVKSGINLFDSISNDGIIDRTVLKKLSDSCSVNIAVPRICFCI